MKNRLSIVKIGGNIIEDSQELSKFLGLFAQMDTPKILVHGGGKRANHLLEKMGISPKMVAGRRITDKATLDVVVMTYAGLTNKNMVAQLQALGCNALGLSGADGNTIKAHKRPIKDIDYGFAGDVDSVNAGLIRELLNFGITPVFCALTHNQEGQLLNTNADTIASELAIGLSSYFDTTLYYCFELQGVLKDIKDPSSVIKKIDAKAYKILVDKGTIANGMLPKMHNCYEALKRGVGEVRIGNVGLFQKENKNYTSLVL